MNLYTDLIIKRPMLAAKIDPEDGFTIEKMIFPKLASPKLDGIRVLTHQNLGPVTRSLKAVPNLHIRNGASDECLRGMDGEMMTLNEDGTLKPFNDIQSDVMSRGGTPSWQFWIFDIFVVGQPYYKRLESLRQYLQSLPDGYRRCTKVVPQFQVNNADEAREMAEKFVEDGYEGIMFRDPNSVYKQGRSTFKQGWLIKHKMINTDSMDDATGVIIGFEPLMHNKNEAVMSELGYMKRSHAKAGMVASTTMVGKAVLRTEWGTLYVGSGFDFAMRTDMKSNPDKYLGKHMDFTYQKFGMKDKPRFGTFKCFRPDLDK